MRTESVVGAHNQIVEVIHGSAGETFALKLTTAGGSPRTADGEAELWEFYDRIPEAYWFVQFLGRNMRNVRLVAAKKNPGSDPSPVGTRVFDGDDTDGLVFAEGTDLDALGGQGVMGYGSATELRAAELVALIEGQGGTEEIMQRGAELTAVVGRGYCVGHVEDDYLTDDGDLVDPVDATARISHWAIYDRSELKKNQTSLDGAKWAMQDEKGNWVPLHKDTWVFPLLDAHPRNHHKPKSAFRAGRDTLRRVCQLQAAQTAIADSRLAARGLFLIAAEWNVEEPEWWNKEGNDAGTWDFATWLHQAIIAPLTNPGQSSAAAPITVEVPYEFLKDGFAFIDFYSEFDKHLAGLLSQDLKRWAVVCDVPTSVMTPEGIENMNHWNIWAVQDSTDKLTWRPVTSVITGAFTTNYLRVMLRREGYEDWNDFVVWGDTSEITAKPNRTEEASVLLAKGLLAEDEVLSESGFSPDQKPSQEERLMNFLRAMALKTADPELERVLLRLIGADVGLGAEVAKALDGAAAPAADPGGAPAEETDSSLPVEGPPAEPSALAAAAGIDVDVWHERLVLVALAESSALEAVRRAGNWLRQRSPKEVRGQLEPMEPWQVPALLGPDIVAGLVAEHGPTVPAGWGLLEPHTFLGLHSRVRRATSEAAADAFIDAIRAEVTAALEGDLSRLANGGTVLDPGETLKLVAATEEGTTTGAPR